MRVFDADALISAWCDGCDSLEKGMCNSDMCVFAEIVKKFPTIDAVPVVRWIPVTERLPKEQGYYLVAHQRSGCVAERFYYRDCPDLFVKVTGDPVTHWMPLPEPPKEVE